jgi:hypothetical protein
MSFTVSQFKLIYANTNFNPLFIGLAYSGDSDLKKLIRSSDSQVLYVMNYQEFNRQCKTRACKRMSRGYFAHIFRQRQTIMFIIKIVQLMNLASQDQYLNAN